MNWAFLEFTTFLHDTQYKSITVKFKPATHLLCLSIKYFMGFLLVEWLTGGGAMLSTCCDYPIGLKTSIIIEDYTTGLPAEPDYGTVSRAFALVLLCCSSLLSRPASFIYSSSNEET